MQRLVAKARGASISLVGCCIAVAANPVGARGYREACHAILTPGPCAFVMPHAKHWLYTVRIRSSCNPAQLWTAVDESQESRLCVQPSVNLCCLAPLLTSTIAQQQPRVAEGGCCSYGWTRQGEQKGENTCYGGLGNDTQARPGCAGRAGHHGASSSCGRKPMGCRFTPVPMHRAQHHRPLARQLGHLPGMVAGGQGTFASEQPRAEPC